ncbi:hypothetical protein [Neorhizobium sp. JUb45]|uniref:hypothetical protein n=1 Tax=unclassified Neorhizobium TaxID=2629175 RepID=UPI00104624E9|nr:hypothetical protein [Neorhizobium sp. JUb45]
MFFRWACRPLPLSWKITAAFWVAIAVLMLSGIVAQQMEWYGLSSRLFAYMALCAVGYVISWLCLAYVNMRHMGRRLKVSRDQDQP